MQMKKAIGQLFDTVKSSFGITFNAHTYSVTKTHQLKYVHSKQNSSFSFDTVLIYHVISF